MTVWTDNTIHIFTDGTYDPTLEKAAYGFVVFKNGKLSYVEKKVVEDKYDAWQVASELQGALQAMRYCVRESHPSFKLFYDWEGIEAFITGRYRAKAEVSQDYLKSYNAIKHMIPNMRLVKINRKLNLGHEVAGEIFPHRDSAIVM